eukprot:6678938-Pyramimonas_sp.AAC.1
MGRRPPALMSRPLITKGACRQEGSSSSVSHRRAGESGDAGKAKASGTDATSGGGHIGTGSRGSASGRRAGERLPELSGCYTTNRFAPVEHVTRVDFLLQHKLFITKLQTLDGIKTTNMLGGGTN